MQNEDVRVSSGSLDTRDVLLKLYEERRFVFGFMSHRIRDRSTQSDIFQQACVKLLMSGASFAHFAPAAKYFYRTVTNLITEHASQASRLQFPERLPEATYDPQPDWDKRMLLDRVCEASYDLSPPERDVLAVSLDDRHPTLKDKARALNTKVSNFRHRRAVIIRKLQKILRKEPHKNGNGNRRNHATITRTGNNGNHRNSKKGDGEKPGS